jgi:hypothetical protein
MAMRRLSALDCTSAMATVVLAAAVEAVRSIGQFLGVSVAGVSPRYMRDRRCEQTAESPANGK